MSFKDDIKKFSQKGEKAATLALRGTALDLFASIMKRTPVDTGRLRGNWQVELNRPATGEVDATAQQAIAKGSSVTGRAKLIDSVYVVNNLPYAAVIERGRIEGNRRVGAKGSLQAPFGMVRVTINDFKQIVEKNARRARR